ncbi:MAG: urate hydroxylase PuuD [Pseudomonadota bacterium]
MYDYAVLWSWAEFAVRWLHVITAIAWIGSSFYFIALDLGLHRDRNLATGADGEEWQVHGGGFYHIQKYLVAPANMPDGLVWFKWESYATWLSGFALLAIVYYLGADYYLIDRNIADLTRFQAIAISIASLGFGWLAYNQLCKWFVNADQTLLMIALFGVLVAMSYFYAQVFTGRAALLHLGAFTATIMSANVFAIIIPNQKIVVADLVAGRRPDAKYGKIAKQRSTHNNYLTLPVIFLMLSNHYPLAFASSANWIIAALVFLMGVTIRHWFNTQHARKGAPYWTWGATVVLFLIIAWLSTAPMFQTGQAEVTRLSAVPGFAEAHAAVQNNCAMCHAADPAWPGLHWPPKGVMLETEAQVTRHALDIYLQAGISHAMPPANITNMPEDDRQAIVAWFRATR